MLKAELEFVEMGGYRHTRGAAWRREFIFQDSQACLNVDATEAHRPCSDCVLTQLVPENLQDAKNLCRYVPMKERGRLWIRCIARGRGKKWRRRWRNG